VSFGRRTISWPKFQIEPRSARRNQMEETKISAGLKEMLSFGPGGPFHPDTPGPWKDSRKVRSSAQVHDERFRECVALQAQYVYNTFGKFPGTVPSIFAMMYLQAHHLDLDFYNRFYKPGAYLESHAVHMDRWHAVPRHMK
jgi:hypothetical protein